MIERPTAVVTGAGSGIGGAIARALAPRGGTVWLLGRTVEKLEATARDVRASGGAARICALDLTVDAEVLQLAAALRDEATSLDVLVHCAGEMARGTVELAPVEQLDRLYRVNLRAPFLLTQTLLPMLREHRGQIVFVNSSSGLSASPEVGQYAATKFALKGLADSLRAEVNAAGVRVLSVFPGRTATPMQAAIHAAEGKAYRPEALVQPEDVAELVVSTLLLPRTAEVTDVSVRPMQKPPAPGAPPAALPPPPASSP